MCSKSEIELFAIPPIQEAIDDSFARTINPVTAIQDNDDSPIEFVIPGVEELFIDPTNIFLTLSGQIVGENGDPLPADIGVYPENNFLHTYFQGCEVFLNETAVSSASVLYHIKSFIESSLNYTRDAKRSLLSSEGYFIPKDEQATVDAYTKSKNKKFNFYGRLRSDIFNQEKLILNRVDIKIKLHRSPSNTHLRVYADNAINPKIKLNECNLTVRRVKISPELQIDIERALMHMTAKYPYTRVDTRIYTLPAQIQTKSIDNMTLGKLPIRVVIGLLPHNTTYLKSSFEFQHFGLSSLALYINGSVVNTPFNMVFNSDNTLCAQAYHALFATNPALAERGNGISLKDFAENGYGLYCFDLTQDLCANTADHTNPRRYGELSLKLAFDYPLHRPISVFAYLEYNAMLEIDRSRAILFDS